MVEHRTLQLGWVLTIAFSLGCNSGEPQFPLDGPGDAGAPDAGPPDAGEDPTPPQVGRCGGPGVFHAPFRKDLRGLYVDPFDRTSVEVIDGRLALKTGPRGYSRVSFFGAIDVSESSVELAVEEVPKQPGLTTIVRLQGTNPGGPQPEARFALANGTITATVVVGTSPSPTKTIPYDPVLHRIVRFREHAKTLTLETSADRVQWSELLSVPSPPWLDHLLLWMELVRRGSVDGRVVFAELNQDVLPASWCPAASRRDDFARGISEGVWYVFPYGSPSGCSTTFLGGDVVFSHQAGGAGECGAGLSTKAKYDLRNSTVEIATKPIKGHRPGWRPTLSINNRSGVSDTLIDLSLYFDNNQMCADNSSDKKCVPYDGALYWRFAHRGSDIVWEVSRDRATWTTIRSEPVSRDDLATVHVRFGVDGAATDTPLEFRVTDYNSP